MNKSFYNLYKSSLLLGKNVNLLGKKLTRKEIDRAKKDQVPAHVIDRAVEKAKGGSGEDFSAARYEGYGPGGMMTIVECLTDNPNRTFGDVRLAFTKTDCKIGTQGSVIHQFDHLAIFVFDFDNEEKLLLKEQGYKTVPQIYNEVNSHIGGYTELLDIFKKEI